MGNKTETGLGNKVETRQPLRIYSDIEARKRDLLRQIKRSENIDTDLMFLMDGAYHVLFAVAELCESKNIDPLNESNAKAEIPRALNVVKELVKQEIKQDTAFTTNRFFKDAKTKTKIQRIIASESSKQPTTSKRRSKRRK